MRARLLRLRLLHLLCFPTAVVVGVGVLPTAAHAQFDDEFDDEFDDDAGDTSDDAGSTDSGSSSSSSDGFGDDDDDFDDDFDSDDDDDADDSLDEDLADADHEGSLDDDADDDDDDADDADDDDDDDDGDYNSLDARLFRAQNTWFGPAGGLHVVDAGGGRPGSFRVQLATEFFFTSDFINSGDQADHIGGSLSLGWTVHENVELWASIQSYANSNNTGDPTLFQVLGDTQIGVKGFGRVLPFLTVGGDFTLQLLNTVGDIGLVFKSTSFGLRGNLTLDLRGLDDAIPFIARLNVQYFFDNSEKLVSGVENARYTNLEDPAGPASCAGLEPGAPCEHRHLINTVERFGLNINRTDFFNIGLGLESPLRLTDGFFLSPLVEWRMGIPVNRQGFVCLITEEGDQCLDQEGVSAFPMDLTIGVRVLPPVDGFSFLLAADIGLTGKSNFVRELSPNAPYNLYLSLAYAYDPEPPAPAEPEIREVERRVEVQLPPPLQGRIRGEVVEQGAGTPVPGAVVRFPGRELTALVADDAGVFTTYALDPGEVQLALGHEEYNDGQCVATIPDERPEEGELIVQVRCELVALPRVGTIAGRVVGADGTAVAGATVALSGPATRNVTAGPDGSFNVPDLPPGTYQARVDAENFLIKTDEVVVVAREAANPTITLVERPRRALVRLRPRDLQIRRKINFATNSAEILPSSEPLLTEIADVLIRNPQVTGMEIQGHTDDRGPAARNRELSQQRADAVRTWLIAHGVESSRLTARGFGPDRPLVPNITPSNRARNRRVQFVITAQAEGPN